MAMATMASVAADDALWQRFVSPSDEARTKVWWFHGETETTEEGIDADLEAFKEKGVGGVVSMTRFTAMRPGRSRPCLQSGGAC